MAAYADRVKDTTTTTGTGDITLSGTAPTGFRSFNTGVGVGPVFGYAISSSGGAEFETGLGYLSGSTTLVRLRVFTSSNSNALVSLSAGTKDVFLTQIAATVADLGLAMAANAGLLMQ
jgi:hypothetical protein